MPTLVNKTFDELSPGDSASTERTLQLGDIRAWGAAFGDADSLSNPAETKGAASIVSGILAALAGSALPGPGTTIRSSTVEVKGALPVGSPLTARLSVREKRPDTRSLLVDGQCTDATGALVATATLEVVPAARRVEQQQPEHRLDGLLTRCAGLPPTLTGVVHPLSADALAGAAEAAAAGLIVPVLFGPADDLHRLADSAHIDLKDWHLVASEGAEDSAAKAAAAAGAGEVAALMKGSLHTDVLLHAVMARESRLRTGRLLSHCAMLSVPTYARRFVVSDVALNIAPDTDQKRDICQIRTSPSWPTPRPRDSWSAPGCR